MSEVKISEKVAAPADEVWELLGDFGGLARWCGPVLQSCTVEGSGVGAVRTIGLETGPSECRIDWEARFEPDGVSEEQARRMLESSYSGSIARVRRLLGA